MKQFQGSLDPSTFCEPAVNSRPPTLGSDSSGSEHCESHATDDVFDGDAEGPTLILMGILFAGAIVSICVGFGYLIFMVLE